MRRRTASFAALAGVLAMSACSAAAPGAPDGEGATTATTVTVFAAASLGDVFGRLTGPFEAEYPGARVVLNVGGSASLAQQLVAGAKADVFASASPEAMAPVLDAGLIAQDAPFARNTLEIAVPAGNPAGVEDLRAFADPDLRIALCAPEVPCGAAAQAAFAAAGVTPAPDTLEQEVTAVLTKVRLGEVDAGLVYRTDVLAAGSEVEGLQFAESGKAATEYRIGAVEGAGPLAAEFVAFVLTDAQDALREAGFAAP
ncbi:MAG TPA: molybdate ABC transporter substrate-binding protein [Naasia sp.]